MKSKPLTKKELEFINIKYKEVILNLLEYLLDTQETKISILIKEHQDLNNKIDKQFFDKKYQQYLGYLQALKELKNEINNNKFSDFLNLPI